MQKYIQAGLVLLYAVLIAFASLLTLEWLGIFIPTATGWTITIGWCVLCYLSSAINDILIQLLPMRYRKCDPETEEKFQRCLLEVLSKVSCDQTFRLTLTSKVQILGPARFTIVLEEGLPVRLTDEELKGLLAQALGHRLDNDTLFAAAFATADWLPRLVVVFSRYAGRLGFRLFGSSRPFPNKQAGYGLSNIPMRIIGWLLVFFVLYRTHLLKVFIVLMVFYGLCRLLHLTFFPLYHLLSDNREYHQDAYATLLGYGPGLLSALKKSIEMDEGKIGKRNTLIAKRIKRLEKNGV